MSACLVGTDIEEIGRSALQDFDQSVSELSKDLCAPFFNEANRLEGKLTTLFQTVSRLARSEPEVEKVAVLWGAMTHVCEDAEKQIWKLSEEHPNCGADYFFDRLHQLKSKCKRLQMMHS
jgi:hypothetical protein